MKFQEQIKLLLGYSSGRINKYIYFNFKGLENSLVTCNGNYETIVSGFPVTLSIQVIEFKDIELFNSIKEFFKIPDNIPYVVRTELLLKALVSSSIDNLLVKSDNNFTTKLANVNNENVVFSMEEEKDESEEDKEEPQIEDNNSEEDEDSSVEEVLDEIILDSFPNNDIFGAVVNDVYAWTLLENEVLHLAKEYTKEYFSNINHKSVPIELDKITWYSSSNQFRPIKLDSSFFNYPDIEFLDFYVVCIDGQDLVSTKGFLKKIEGECNLYIWSKNKKSIKCMAIYEDSSVVIKSIRPFYEIIPLIKKKTD